VSDPSAIGYDDIGGLDAAVSQVRELVELPLANPEPFRALNITAPHGVLLSGPPGTGKTQLVHALTAEADVSLVTVRGATVVSRDGDEENPSKRRWRRRRRTRLRCCSSTIWTR